MPTDQLGSGGWERAHESVDTVFQLPAMRVRGSTVQYEDERTRRALAAATDETLDESTRFFAGTRLTFDPPLPPGATAVMIAPTLKSEARRTFASRLRERGLVDVARDGSQQIRVGDRRRATVTKFAAVNPLDDWDQQLPLACWVAVWTDTDSATIVTGGHPTVALASHLGLDTTDEPLRRSGESYREEFFRLLRAVD